MDVRPAQGPIQRGFEALLGFLGIKGAATNPNSMAGYVQPTLNVYPFLVNRPHKRLLITGSLTADSSGPFFAPSPYPTPPDGKCWLFRSAWASLNIDELQTVRSIGITRSLADPARGEFEDLTTSMRGAPWSNEAAGGQPPFAGMVTANCTQPFILLPRETLGVNVQGFLHGGQNQVYRLEAYYLEIDL